MMKRPIHMPVCDHDECSKTKCARRAVASSDCSAKRRFSDEQIREWAKRHDLCRGGSLTDLRSMFEDAASTSPNSILSGKPAVISPE